MTLTIDEVATIDLPPVPDIATGEALDLTLETVPPFNALAGDAPLIGVIDSGVNDHPLLADIIVGSIGVPSNLGTADEWGHGTRVAGVAVFGDLRAQLGAGTLERGARICAAKVVNERGQFEASGWCLVRCGTRSRPCTDALGAGSSSSRLRIGDPSLAAEKWERGRQLSMSSRGSSMSSSLYRPAIESHGKATD